jgi:hypothetical protein
MARKALKEGYADKGLPVLSLKKGKKKTARKKR